MAGSRISGLSAVAVALLDPSKACPPGLSAWNGSDPAARFAVHRRNVIASLVSALADTFPVVRQLVGDEFFRAMAARAVVQMPPRAPMLAGYGEGFPAFVADFEPAADVRCLADVARLEWARVRASQAADVEALPIAALTRAWSAHAGRIDEVRLRLHPSVSVLRSREAVVSIWAAHQGQGSLADVDADVAENAWVQRVGLEVVVQALAPGTAAFVDALSRGAALGPATAAAAGEDDGFDLAAALRFLIGQSALVAVGAVDQDP